jgi:hypothetical protein
VTVSLIFWKDSGLNKDLFCPHLCSTIVLDGTCVEPVKEMPATLGEVQRTLPTSAAFACPLVTTFITPAKYNKVYATCQRYIHG